MARTPLSLLPLSGMPAVLPGDSAALLILEALKENGTPLQDGDILVVAQKIVSKAEGRFVDLKSITPSSEAEALAKETEKDPRLVEVILSQTAHVVKYRVGVLIVESVLGLVHANAGIDHSNVVEDNGDMVLLLPEDPDRSAKEMRSLIKDATGKNIGIIINDSMGRAWRNGTVGHAIGSAGIGTVQDLRGTRDMFGTPLEVTSVAVADELAAAASYVMGQAGEAVPAVLIKGARASLDENGTTADLLRARDEDLFR